MILLKRLKNVTGCWKTTALLLKTVNHQGFSRRILKEQWSGYRPPDHLVYFGPENLRALLLRIGFRSVKMTAMPFNDSFYCDAWR